MEHQPKHTSSNSTKQRCQHRFANRKRCMMSTLHQDPLCPAHAKLQRVEETATELTANLTTFKSAEELNDFLSSVASAGSEQNLPQARRRSRLHH